jgi:proteasome lid subunit RPN8/RPN11
VASFEAAKLESFLTLTGSGDLRAIHFSHSVLQPIRLVATEKFLSIPRGGLEIGGVLFGRFEDGEAAVLAFRELAIEYRSGPSFVLSDSDEAALRSLLLEASADPALAGLSALGWYHTHTRSDLTLSPEDVRVQERFFGAPGQFAVVIKPYKFEPAQAAIYCSGRDSLALWGAFEIGRMPTAREDLPPREIAAPTPAPLPVPMPVPVRTVQAETPRAVEPRRGRPWWPAAIAAMVLLGVLLGIGLLREAPLSPELRMSGSGNELTISWNSTAPWVQRVTSGELYISEHDQPRLEIPLDAAFLRRGSITYSRSSDAVFVRMIVQDPKGRKAETSARFVGALPAKPAPPAESDPQMKAIRAEVEQLKAELDRARSESGRARTVPPEPTPTRRAQPEPAPTRAVQAAANKSVAGSNEFDLPPPVKLQPNLTVTLPRSEPVPTPPVAIQESGAPSTPTASRAAPPSREASPEPPRKGRAIWTGSLEPGGHLLISAQKASTGVLSGTLPRGAARMTVQPADLASSGVVVFRAQGAKSAVEPPSASNGWNLTTYRLDPKRARALTVLEYPNPANGFKRLMLRAEDRPLTMVVIQWEELPAEGR